MYYEDLSDASFEARCGDGPGRYNLALDRQGVFVGWLAPEEGHEFTNGEMPDDFLAALKARVEKAPSNWRTLYRGFHTCPVCSDETCSYTVEIPNLDQSKWYLVPSLIVHYVGGPRVPATG